MSWSLGLFQERDVAQREYLDTSDIQYWQRVEQLLRLGVNEPVPLGTPGASVKVQAVHVDAFSRRLFDAVQVLGWVSHLACQHDIIQRPLVGCMASADLLLHCRQEALCTSMALKVNILLTLLCMCFRR